MMVLVTFISIGMAAVLFLLRFLFAIESDLRAARRTSARPERVFTVHSPSLASTYGAAGLTLIHFNSEPAFRERPATQGSFLQQGKKSRIKRA